MSPSISVFPNPSSTFSKPRPTSSPAKSTGIDRPPAGQHWSPLKAQSRRRSASFGPLPHLSTSKIDSPMSPRLSPPFFPPFPHRSTGNGSAARHYPPWRVRMLLFYPCRNFRQLVGTSDAVNSIWPRAPCRKKSETSNGRWNFRPRVGTSDQSNSAVLAATDLTGGANRFDRWRQSI